MKKILYINACVRAESRTDILGRAVLERETGSVEEVRLEDEHILPLDRKSLEERNELLEKENYSDPSLRFAKQFADANVIVIAAPYWDLSFPALLRAYLERINAAGITFRYTETGAVESLCHAEKLVYVTTSGGPVFEPHMGYNYVKNFAEAFYGIEKFEYYKAEGLDIPGTDVEKTLENVKAAISRKVEKDVSE